MMDEHLMIFLGLVGLYCLGVFTGYAVGDEGREFKDALIELIEEKNQLIYSLQQGCWPQEFVEDLITLNQAQFCLNKTFNEEHCDVISEITAGKYAGYDSLPEWFCEDHDCYCEDDSSGLLLCHYYFENGKRDHGPS